MKGYQAWICVWVGVLGMGWLPVYGQEATYEDRPLITAPRVAVAPVIDGQVSSGEWSAASPVHVEFSQPGVEPGISRSSPPDSEDDLSFDIRTLYDDQYLYVAVVVRDDAIFDDSPGDAWKDDDVEVYIDGDLEVEVGFTPSAEGFQVLCDVGGDMGGLHEDATDWTAAAGLLATGYVVEFRISLNSIDTVDGDGEEPPAPGDYIRFTVAVGDHRHRGPARCGRVNGWPTSAWGRGQTSTSSKAADPPDRLMTRTLGLWAYIRPPMPAQGCPCLRNTANPADSRRWGPLFRSGDGQRTSICTSKVSRGSTSLSHGRRYTSRITVRPAATA